MTMAPRLERAAAIFLTRTMLGFVYFFSGIQRVGGANAALDMTAWMEIAVGAFLLLGLWSRPVLRLLVVGLVAYTLWLGFQGLTSAPGSLGATSMDIRIINFYVLPRAILVIVTLLLPSEDDLLSVDAVLDRRARQLA